MPWANKIKV